VGRVRLVVDRDAQLPAAVVRHLVVVLQEEAHELRPVLPRQGDFLVLGLNVKLGVRGGLALFVQRFGLPVKGLKRCQLVFRQPPLGLARFGHVNKIAAPLDKIRLFCWNAHILNLHIGRFLRRLNQNAGLFPAITHILAVLLIFSLEHTLFNRFNSLYYELANT
jgi:hypothetical protein